MLLAIVINLVVILAIAAFVGFVANPDVYDGKAPVVVTLAVAWGLTVLSFWGWVIYVALHFISKHW